MQGLVKENIQLNTKVLSELSIHEPHSIKALVGVSHTTFPENRAVKRRV
jgi:large subunit ribosomal protein L20